MKKINVILGSTRDGRNGIKVANWFMNLAKATKDSDLSFELVDLSEWNIPFIESAMPPSMGTYPAGITTDWAKKMEEADGYIIISPEYNHGYTAVLKNALDVIYKEWNYKPVTFVGYGAVSGGIRAIEQLRQVVIELRMIPLKEDVTIQNVWAAFDENGEPVDASITTRATGMIEALGNYFKKN